MRTILAAALLLWSPIAAAAGMTVQVRSAGGAPVAGAVVTVRLAGGRATPAAPAAAGRSVSQQNLQFHPFILVVPVGTAVTFPNLDRVRHHVYSFAPAKKFELKLFAKEQSRSVLFDKPGIVPIGCNIHDQMSAFIAVVDTPWAAQSDDQGNVSFANLPPGPVTVSVWHPYLRAPGNMLSRASTANGQETFVATLRAPPHAVGGAAY